MKKLKLLTSVLLIVSLLLSICPQVFATSVEWLLQYPIVASTVYGYFDRGVVVGNGSGTQSFVAFNGVTVIPYESGYESISIVDKERGYIACRDKSGRTCVMDIYRNVIMPAGAVDHVYQVLEDNRVVAGKQTYMDSYGYRYYDYGVTDLSGNIIVPYGVYESFEADRHGTIIVRDKVEYTPGILGQYGEVIVPVGMYESVYTTGSPYRFVADDYTTTSLIDNAGNVIAQFDGSVVEHYDYPFENYFCVYNKDTDKTTVYDLNGNPVKELEGRNYFINEKYFKTETSLADLNGNVIIQADKYSYFEVYGDYIVATTQSWKKELLDINGNVLIPEGSIKFYSVEDNKYLTGGNAIMDVFGTPIVDGSWNYLGRDTFINFNWNEKSVEVKFVKVNDAPVRELKQPEPPAVSVVIDGMPVQFTDQAPVIIEGRTLLPLRMVFELLGATIDWNGDTQTVTATKDGVTVTITIGSNQLFVNDEAKTLDVPAQILNSRTMVPVRAASEAFGCGVGWDATTSTVTITK